MVRSSFSTRNIANYDNNLGKSDPNTALDIEREDEDSIRMACNVNDSGAESIILRSDEDEDEDEDENEYGEGYSDDDDEDQLYDDEGEDRVSRVFGDADFLPSEYSQGPYNGGGDFIQDLPPVEQNTDGAEQVDDPLQPGESFTSQFVADLTPTSRWRSFGRSSINPRCPESRQFGKRLFLFKYYTHG